MDIIMLIGGLLLILAGANFMTDGSASVARRMGLSDFIVGLTIVSMMTSAPELVVSITSAVNQAPSMAVGNIVGSNIFNILIIIGLVAVIKPIKVENGLLYNEIPLVILSSLVLLTMGSSPILDGTPMTLTRVDGILLLFFFIIFMRYTIASAKKTDPAPTQTKEQQCKKEMPLWRALIFIFGGLAALVFGGEWFVDGATGVARSMGWSEGLIGLTILAAGTSLPELATSIAAAIKGFPGLCVGNVIGSNIFNIFFVLGATSTILPLSFGNIGIADLLVLAAASLIFWIFGWFFSNKTINRIEGLLMVLSYIAYIAWKIANQ